MNSTSTAKTQAALPQPVDEHFEQTLGELKKIEQQKKALPRERRDEEETEAAAFRRLAMTTPEQSTAAPVESLDPTGQRTGTDSRCPATATRFAPVIAAAKEPPFTRVPREVPRL